MTKNALEERTLIVKHPEKRPYGIRISFLVQTLGAIGNLENASINMPSGAIATLRPALKAPWENGYKGELIFEAFPTAAAAEYGGRRLVQALLWTAIQQKSPIQLQYRSYEPALVFERGRSDGATMFAFSDVTKNPTQILDSIADGYGNLPDPDPTVLLSMEIFAGANLETSERAKYLATISALEPLAKKSNLKADACRFIDEMLEAATKHQDIDSETRNSLLSRIRLLKQNSIRQSLKKFVAEVIPEIPDAWDQVDEAYSLRSQIIHTGRPNDLDTDLSGKTRALERIMEAIYQNLLIINASQQA